MKKNKIKVGIIGCGAIGREIAKACQKRLKDKIELVAVADVDQDRADAMQKMLGGQVSILNADSLIKKSGLIVEAASAAVSVTAMLNVVTVTQKMVTGGKIVVTGE